jgi:dTDP-4-dehydrorhamnose reductase
MIWLIGNKGMLGTQLASALAAAGLPAVCTDREVDILDPAALNAFAAGKDIRWLVNCAAYTAVDKAEEEEALALRLNAEGPANLAALAHSLGARLLHLSTDYVFSGSATEPYSEDTPVSPAGAYGRTKAEGERRVMAAAPDSVILRTAWLYGRHGPNFVYTMLRLMKERSTLGVVADQHGTPTNAADLSAAIVCMITLPQLPAGIYHYTNAGATTWYDFAREIYRLGRLYGLLERDCTINPLTTAEYPTKAARPAYSVLSKDKIQALGVQVPAWEESLAGFVAGLE